ncbi:urea transporter [Pseudomonas cavernae]|uniref:Urea transporter n=1 Tax=Pseudomonas cavernae TaxID=2320867 RepID=A0A385Z251_9PSED|nr:urea transporter [Pseudomonas cavernae]AYC32570.1 urea transporter [Pseudomonas cavernae]
MNRLLSPRTLSLAKALLNGCSQIFLQRHPLCGALVLLAIALGAPPLLGGALLGALAGLLVAHRLNYARADVDAGLYGYNATLVGLVLAMRFNWSLSLALLILAAAALATVLLHLFLHRGRLLGGLPVYTLPFVLFGWLTLPLDDLPGLDDRSIVASALPLDAPGLADAALRGIGQVIFLDSPLAGACLLLGLLLADWRAAAWALGASAAGLSLALLQGWPQPTALLGLYGYNAVLAAIALSQSHRRPWAPLAGILLTLLLQPCFTALAVPPLTAPFILACWLVLTARRGLQKRTAGANAAGS